MVAVSWPSSFSAAASIWLAADIILGLAQCILLVAQQHSWISPLIAGYLPGLYTFLYTWPILAVVFVFTRGLAWPWWERAVAFAVLLSGQILWLLVFGLLLRFLYRKGMRWLQSCW